MGCSFKDKMGITITNAFQNVLDESNHKPNKTWVDKGTEFYNTLMRSWLQHNDIKIYSILSEGKSLVSERFSRTLRIYKYMTSLSKKVYINRLGKIVNK